MQHYCKKFIVLNKKKIMVFIHKWYTNNLSISVFPTFALKSFCKPTSKFLSVHNSHNGRIICGLHLAAGCFLWAFLANYETAPFFSSLFSPDS